MGKRRYLYVVRDIVADDYGPIFEAVNDLVADRSFKQILRNAAYPNDFELHCLGFLDENLVLCNESREVEITAEKIELEQDGDKMLLDLNPKK